jgi:hypothetical protein
MVWPITITSHSTRRHLAVDWLTGWSTMDVVPRSVPVRRIALKDEGKMPHARLAPHEGLAMMWQLALQAWMFKEGLVDEPRLHRDVVRTLRGGR